MPDSLSMHDPRHPQYKWHRFITRAWKLHDPRRARACDRLAVRLHNAMGGGWGVFREEGAYAIRPAGPAPAAPASSSCAAVPPLAIVRFALWKQSELAVGFAAGYEGSYAAAAELIPRVEGLFAGDTAQRFYCAMLPDEGQEDEIVMTVSAFARSLAKTPAAI